MDDNHHFTNVTMLDHPDYLVTSIVSTLLVGAPELTATRVLISTFLILTVASWVSTLRKRASLTSSTCCDAEMVQLTLITRAKYPEWDSYQYRYLTHGWLPFA
jgi:hypothetical protein